MVINRPEQIVFTKANFREIPQLKSIPQILLDEIETVATVLPFRVNNHVLNELIDWENINNDPIFKMTFPQKGMLRDDSYGLLADLLANPKTTPQELELAVFSIRMSLNPDSSNQMSNVPNFKGMPLNGVQHKYRETVLFFPAQGQVCHSYCTYCFRWPQFIGIEDLKFSAKELTILFEYLKDQKDVTDILITGGDPMVVNTRQIATFLEPLLLPAYDHIKNIRIGTKSLTFWPYRYTDDADCDELLRLFEKLIAHGKHIALMTNCSHVNELKPEVCRLAIKRILNTGVVLRSQGPVLANVNDNAEVWSALWQEQVRLGIIPYYMFVERNTGAHNYFEIPLERTLQIYNGAMKNISGLCKTARGPVMSAAPGKIELLGIQEINREKVFLLRFLQARNTDWLNKPFFAAYDASATWFDQLKPAFGEQHFFFEN